MLERIIAKLDVLPGGKTYYLAGAAAILYYGNMVGIIPADIYAQVNPWVIGLMAPTVALKLAR